MTSNYYLRALLWTKILLVCLLLVGCSKDDLTGTWYDPQGVTEMTFKEDTVYFFDSFGTYEIRGKYIVMTFNERELKFEYVLEEDLLIHYNDVQIRLKRKED